MKRRSSSDVFCLANCLLMAIIRSAGPAAGVEFCQFEMVNISCALSGQVILVDSAFYGRLALGRCVTRDYGHVGCSVDVRNVIDETCSGRLACILPVTRIRQMIGSSLQQHQPCPSDLTSHLDLTYHCVPVLDLSKLRCNDIVHIHNIDSPVYISSYNLASIGDTVTMATGQTADCPLQFEVHKGQTINVTLYSFTSRHHMPVQHYATTLTDSQSDLSPQYNSLQMVDRRYCPVHAFITDGLHSYGVALCSYNRRQKTVYQSHLSHIALHISQTQQSHLSFSDVNSASEIDSQLTTNRAFVIELKPNGCRDTEAKEGQWVERYNDRLLIVCNNSRQVMYMTCVNSQWIGASHVSCQTTTTTTTAIVAEAVSTGLPNRRNTAIFSSSQHHVRHFGVELAVLIGALVGLGCGLTLLGFVFVHRRRRHPYNSRNNSRQMARRQRGTHCSDLTKYHQVNERLLLQQSTKHNEQHQLALDDVIHCVTLRQSSPPIATLSYNLLPQPADNATSEKWINSVTAYEARGSSDVQISSDEDTVSLGSRSQQPDVVHYNCS